MRNVQCLPAVASGVCRTCFAATTASSRRRVGYTGGNTPNATYRNHGSHAEAVEIIFDPARISYRQILEFFFQIHDPSTRNRQGNDVGTSYRSAIFYTTDEQRRIAEDTIADVDASGLWPGKVVTEVVPAGSSGKPNPSIRTIWCATPAATPAISFDPAGSCRFARARERVRRNQVTSGASSAHVQPVEQLLRRFEIAARETLGKSAVDRG